MPVPHDNSKRTKGLTGFGIHCIRFHFQAFIWSAVGGIVKGDEVPLHPCYILQARSYVQAQGGSCLIVPRRLNFFETQILRKIIIIVATRCQILTLKCTKFDFGWGSAPDPAGGAYSTLPDPLAGFKGAYF